MLNVIETVSAVAAEQDKPFSVALEAAPIDELIIERDAAAAKLARLSAAFDDRINDAEHRRQAVNGALRQHLNDERVRLLAWANGAGKEDPPCRDVEAYARLLAAVEDAERAHEAAVAARATVEPHFARVMRDLHEVQKRLDNRTAQSIADEVLEDCRQITETLDSVLIKFSRVIAAREAIYRRAQQFHAEQQPDRGVVWSSAAGRLVDIANKLVLAPGPADTAKHFDYWQAKMNGGNS